MRALKSLLTSLVSAVLLGGTLLGGVLWSSVAAAACPDPYTGAELATDLSVLGTSLRDQDLARFSPAAARMEAGLPCVEQAVPRQALASAYRFIGVSHYKKGDEASARRWLRTSLELEATYNFDVDEVDFADPLRTVFEAERTPSASAPAAVAGKSLKTPDGTEWLLDGRPLQAPSATTDRPHLLLQVNKADQKVLGAWLIDGNSFPTEALQETVVAAAAPTKEKKPKAKVAPQPVAAPTDDTAYQVVKIERIRPPMKTPLIILGGAGVLGSGAVYALSFSARKEFDTATTTEALLAAQKKTNLLVIASGATLAVGLGVGYVGVSLDTGPGWMIGARF